MPVTKEGRQDKLRNKANSDIITKAMQMSSQLLIIDDDKVDIKAILKAIKISSALSLLSIAASVDRPSEKSKLITNANKVYRS